MVGVMAFLLLCSERQPRSQPYSTIFFRIMRCFNRERSFRLRTSIFIKQSIFFLLQATQSSTWVCFDGPLSSDWLHYVSELVSPSRVSCVVILVSVVQLVNAMKFVTCTLVGEACKPRVATQNYTSICLVYTAHVIGF